MIAGKNSLVLSFLILFTPSFVFAQKKTKIQLQRERQENVERIKETEKILEETEREKKSSLGELVALNKRISQQENLVSTIKDEIECAVPCMGKAGSMSFHHVRALHGSAMNTSDRPRNLLLYEVAASDAWPLMGVKDFDEFNSRLLSGEPVIAPRMTNVPVRLPLPPAKRQGSIYETQSAAKKSYFTRAA